MNIQKIDYTILIEIRGAYLVTESNSCVEAYSQLHNTAWDSIQYFNDNLIGYIESANIDVEICKDMPWIREDRGNNP